jgi:PAS domain S-box-containing protein
MEKARILIVEDEAIIAMEIESQLQSLGYEVTSIVNTGEKAIQKAEEDKPDIILMDIRIKGEMDGIDAAAEIRSKLGIPVIFSTAYLDEERIERAKITMPFGYVLKPIQERDLKVTIEMALYVSKVDAERKQTEEDLRSSENKMRSIFSVAPTGIGMVKNRVLYEVNPRFCEMTGYSEEELIGKSARMVYPSQEEFDFVGSEKYKQIAEHGSGTVETRFQKKDGSILHILLASTPIDVNDQLKGVTFTATDITERKQAEDDLKKHNNFHIACINSIQHPFYVIDVKTKKIKHANIATGIDVVGKTCHMVTHDSPIPCNTKEHPCPINIILETKKTTLTQHTHLMSDGTEKIIEMHASPIFDENGDVEFIAESNIEIN